MTKIAVLGAGAMGSFFGARLAASGISVTLIDIDPSHIEATNSRGLRLTTDAREFVIPVRIGRAESLREPVDILLVFTKTPHTLIALDSVRHLISADTWAVTLQNGLDAGDRLVNLVPRTRVAVGVTNWPADLAGPGHVVSRGEGAVRLWSLSGASEPAVFEIARLLDAAGLCCRADPAVQVAIWEKVSFNAAMNAIAAVSGMRVGEMADSAEIRALAADVVREAVATGRAEGVEVQETHVWGAIENAYSGHRNHRPSMLQDLLAGRRTEIDSINGAIVEHASKSGLSAPVNQTLTRLVRAIENRK